jgi:hypothetical protein
MTLNIKTLIRTIFKKHNPTNMLMLLVIQHNDTQHYEAHHNNVMLSDAMLSVIKILCWLSYVITVIVIIMLNAIMVGIIMLNVMAPTCLPLLVTNDI